MLVVEDDGESARGELAGAREAGRTGADDRDAVSVRPPALAQGMLGGERGVGRVALQARDLDRGPAFVGEHTDALAEHLDGTDTRARRTEQIAS